MKNSEKIKNENSEKIKNEKLRKNKKMKNSEKMGCINNSFFLQRGSMEILPLKIYTFRMPLNRKC